MSALPMTADLVARLLACADEVEQHPHPSHCDHLHVAHKLLREAASALRSSGEAVAWICPDHLREQQEYAERAGYFMVLVAATAPQDENSIPLYLHPATPASAWRPIAEAQEGKLYVVGWLDGEDTKSPARHDFDYIEDGCWVGHEDCVQHADACAPPGSRLPPREPPYQWLIEVPEFPTPPTSTKQPAASAALER